MPNENAGKTMISKVGSGLQNVCNFIAVAQTNSQDEVLKELILLVLFEFSGEKIGSIEDIDDILRSIFGVEAPNHQIRKLMDQLITAGDVQQPLGTNYILSVDTKATIKDRVEKAKDLQEAVKI